MCSQEGFFRVPELREGANQEECDVRTYTEWPKPRDNRGKRPNGGRLVHVPLVRSPRSRVGVCGVLGRGAGRGPRKVCPCAHRLVAGGLRGSRRGGPESHPGKLTRTPPAETSFFQTALALDPGVVRG